MNNRHFNIFNGKLVGLISALLFLLSCGSNTNKYTDTPTSGEITICVDETFKPIIDSELSVFHLLYNALLI
jgi:phosphate transport system substrate-binding protein